MPHEQHLRFNNNIYYHFLIIVVRPISEFVYDIGNDFCVEMTNFTGLTAVIKCEPGGEEIPQPSVRWKLNTFSIGIFLLPIAQVPYFTINESNRNSLTIDLTSFLELERFGIVCERINAFGFQNVRTIISVCSELLVYLVVLQSIKCGFPLDPFLPPSS